MVMGVSIKTVIKKKCPRFVLSFYYSMRGYLDRKYRGIKYSSLIKSTHVHYIGVEKRIKERRDNHLKFASYVVYDSTFGAYKLMDLMLADVEHYTPRIVICPDISRGQNHLKEQYRNTKDFFIKKYGKDFVIDGYDIETGDFIDVSDQFDIVYLSNPYDHMVNEVHGIKYLSKKDLLPMYISYCFQPVKYTFSVMSSLEISLFWKVFTDTQFTLAEYQRYELSNGKNVILTGYAKMDSLCEFREKKREKKRIIIASHHTVDNDVLPLSNFLEYQDFYLNLPILFPQIEFIFRPHPLLFINMVNQGYWQADDVDKYLHNLMKNGIIYSSGGDYLDIFVNSDAIIHDCSSFIVEYLFTNKPCCFMAKDNYKKNFSRLGKECLKNYYIAYDKNQVIDFIESIVLNENDCKKIDRKTFTDKYLAINHPNVSKKILDVISI